MKKISWKDFLVGVLVATIFFMLLGAKASNNGPGKYAVSVAGIKNVFSVCVTDTWTGETRCKIPGLDDWPEHSYSPKF